MTARPTVRLSTPLGDIVIRLESERAPITAQNFLDLVRGGAYRGGEFHRTVRDGNGANADMDSAVIGRGMSGDRAAYRLPDDRYPIHVVQAGAGPGLGDREPIPLERTRDTGLRHLAGTISMSRQTPDSAVSDFFLCLRDEPELDHGGRRNADGEGFAAFGRVIAGMPVVRLVHRAPAVGQRLAPPIPILDARVQPTGL